MLDFFKRRLRRAPVHPSSPLVVVYTPGKDGGTSVRDAVRAAGLECHHIHGLEPTAIKRQMREALDRDALPLEHISMSAALRPQLIHRSRDIRLVALVRDQLERTLAALFQNLHDGVEGLSADSPPEEIFETWRTRTNHTHGLGWFDREYRDQLGIDVLGMPFDKKARLQHYPDHKLLVMRIDCDPEMKNAALTQHVGRPVTLGRANVGGQKPYAAAYGAVKQMAWAPDRLIEEVYGSRHMRHFWTEAELEEMRARWRRG